MRTALTFLTAALLVCVAPAAASVLFGPYGPGGAYNGYEYVPSGLSWGDAKTAAEARSFAGVSGHLVTITSAAENEFVRIVGRGDPWIGLTDNDAYGGTEFGNTSGHPYPPAGDRGNGWVWVTGEPTGYRNWNNSEPNDWGGNEDGAQILGNGLWNDNGAWKSIPYVVEYELASAWPAPPGGTPGFNVRYVKAADGIDLWNLDRALQLLAGLLPSSSELYGYESIIDLGGGGHYGNAFPFPGQYYDQFALRATADIEIPSAGDWTFGVNSDDGFRVVFEGIGSFEFADPRGPADTLATFNFPTPGLYRMHLLFYERGGGEEVEFFAAPGAHSSWNSDDFRLVGDVANGGLAAYTIPEPTTLALVGLGGLLVARRRRRR